MTNWKLNLIIINSNIQMKWYTVQNVFFFFFIVKRATRLSIWWWILDKTRKIKKINVFKLRKSCHIVKKMQKFIVFPLHYAQYNARLFVSKLNIYECGTVRKQYRSSHLSLFERVAVPSWRILCHFSHSSLVGPRQQTDQDTGSSSPPLSLGNREDEWGFVYLQL